MVVVLEPDHLLHICRTELLSESVDVGLEVGFVVLQLVETSLHLFICFMFNVFVYVLLSLTN